MNPQYLSEVEAQNKAVLLAFSGGCMPPTFRQVAFCGNTATCVIPKSDPRKGRMEEDGFWTMNIKLKKLLLRLSAASFDTMLVFIDEHGPSGPFRYPEDVQERRQDNYIIVYPKCAGKP